MKTDSLERRLGDDADAGAVFGLVGPGHDSRFVGELPPHLPHHFLRRDAHRRQGPLTGQARQNAAEEGQSEER